MKKAAGPSADGTQRVFCGFIFSRKYLAIAAKPSEERGMEVKACESMYAMRFARQPLRTGT